MPGRIVQDGELLRNLVTDALPKDLLHELVRTALRAVMEAEVSALCGAGPRERSEERQNSRNGYDHVRAYVRVRRTVRKVCLCTHCLRRLTPPRPPMPFDRAACTTEMMAWGNRSARLDGLNGYGKTGALAGKATAHAPGRGA